MGAEAAGSSENGPSIGDEEQGHPGLSDNSAANTSGMAGPAGPGDDTGLGNEDANKGYAINPDDVISFKMPIDKEPPSILDALFSKFDPAAYATPGFNPNAEIAEPAEVGLSILGQVGPEADQGPDGPPGLIGVQPQQQAVQPLSLLASAPSVMPQQSAGLLASQYKPAIPGFWRGNEFVNPGRRFS